MDETIRVEAAADALTEVSIDLSAALEGDTGQLVVIVEPEGVQSDQDRYWRTIQAWVQVTQVGLDAFADHSEMVVWTTALQDGSPLGGVTIEDDAGRKGGGHRRRWHGQVRTARSGHAIAGCPPGR